MNDQEIFDACARGQAVRVQELLDSGVDVNIRDYDREDTPLHAASAKGQKAVMEMLVENAADVNAQNNRGQTPLHSLVKKRFDLMALWLVRQGADINLEDDKGCSARDFALDWFQTELDEAAAGVLPEGALEAQQAMEEERARQERDANSILSPRSVPQGAQERHMQVMKIHMRNESYKTMIVDPVDTSRDVCAKMAKKLGIEDLASHFDIISTTKADDRRLTPGENIFEVKKKWPSGDSSARFILVLKRGTPAHVVEKFRSTLR